MFKVDLLMSEGVDYINVGMHSKTKLGKMLAIGCPVNTKTIFGNIGSIRNAIDYATTVGYPIKLLGKKKLKKVEVLKIPKVKLNLVNYKSVLAYLVCARIKNDKELIKLLVHNELPLSSYTIREEKSLGINALVCNENNVMVLYVSVLTDIVNMIRHDKFSDVDIRKYIVSKKTDVNQPVFADLAVSVVSDL